MTDNITPGVAASLQLLESYSYGQLEDLVEMHLATALADEGYADAKLALELTHA